MGLVEQTRAKQGKAVRLTEWQVTMLFQLVDRELDAEVKVANDENGTTPDRDAYRTSLRALWNKLANV